MMKCGIQKKMSKKKKTCFPRQFWVMFPLNSFLFCLCNSLSVATLDAKFGEFVAR